MSITEDVATSASGTRLTSKGRATRERIVVEATGLMLERGVARTTIEDIQAAAGVSASQMYHYFADKEELVLAVIDHATDEVMSLQHRGLDALDSLERLRAWRDLVVSTADGLRCEGGCPLGSLASDLSETDPVARARLMGSFGQWEALLRHGLEAMQERGTLRPEADPEGLALALLTAVQGGLLLSQVRRSTVPLEVALDAVIAHVATFAV